MGGHRKRRDYVRKVYVGITYQLNVISAVQSWAMQRKMSNRMMRCNSRTSSNPAAQHPPKYVSALN